MSLSQVLEKAVKRDNIKIYGRYDGMLVNNN